MLMSSSDLVCMFLASYGLYIFVTLYRDTVGYTTSCLTSASPMEAYLFAVFILFCSAFLYANWDRTSLDTGIDIYNDLFHSISYDTESIKLIYPEPSIIMSSIVYTLANTPKALALKENKGNLPRSG